VCVRACVCVAIYTASTAVLDEIQARNVAIIGLVPILRLLPTPGLRRIKAGVQNIQDMVRQAVSNRKLGKSHSLTDGTSVRCVFNYSLLYLKV